MSNVSADLIFLLDFLPAFLCPFQDQVARLGLQLELPLLVLLAFVVVHVSIAATPPIVSRRASFLLVFAQRFALSSSLSIT